MIRYNVQEAFFDTFGVDLEKYDVLWKPTPSNILDLRNLWYEPKEHTIYVPPFVYYSTNATDMLKLTDICAWIMGMLCPKTMQPYEGIRDLFYTLFPTFQCRLYTKFGTNMYFVLCDSVVYAGRIAQDKGIHRPSEIPTSGFFHAAILELSPVVGLDWNDKTIPLNATDFIEDMNTLIASLGYDNYYVPIFDTGCVLQYFGVYIVITKNEGHLKVNKVVDHPLIHQYELLKKLSA